MAIFRTTQVTPHLPRLDLGIGQPQMRLLPLDLIGAGAAEFVAAGDPGPLNYGLEQGDEGLRAALAAFLEERTGVATGPEQIMITCGASQGLDLVCTLFAEPGDTVFVEEPSYFLALRILADYRLRLVTIPTGENGLDLDRLEERLRRGERPAFLYTIPTFQNPGGSTLPQAGRERLAALSRQYGLRIVADEVYQLLHYGPPPPPPLAAWVGEADIISLNSFSKILAPGLRLGWITADPPLLEQLIIRGLVDSGGGLNPFTSAVVRPLVAGGRLGTYLDQLRAIYGRRIEVMDRALRDNFGDSLRYHRPDGGYFFWLRLADGRDTAALLPRAHEYGAGYQPGVRFSSENGLHDYLRLSFAFYDEDDLVEAIGRLAAALAPAN